MKLLFLSCTMVIDLMLVLVIVFATTNAVVVSVPVKTTSHMTIVGAVYCDTCYENTFSRHSYFLPGVEVHVQCKFKANSPKTTEQIAFSVNRTTNRYGVYKLDIPSVEDIDCVDNESIQSFCETSLVRSRTPQCNIPNMKTTTNTITVKSKRGSLCIYSLSALSFKPPEKNTTLCGKQKQNLKNMKYKNTYDSSKFFLPYFPPYVFPWPNLPPLPQLPPLPKLPFPNFPFPQAPPSFNWGDPNTWIPNNPFFSSPPSPPAFNWGDPRTWIPNIPNIPPLFSPPPPPPLPQAPTFDWRNPRTWIPNPPPRAPTSTSTSTSPQNSQP